MAGSKFSAAGVIVLLVVVLSNMDVSRSQDIAPVGIVRFTNKSNMTTVTIKNIELGKTVSDLGFNSTADFNQSIDSSVVYLFQITDSRTKSLIVSLVVPTGMNVSFVDVKNYPDVVVAVGSFP